MTNFKNKNDLGLKVLIFALGFTCYVQADVHEIMIESSENDDLSTSSEELMLAVSNTAISNDERLAAAFRLAGRKNHSSINTLIDNISIPTSEPIPSVGGAPGKYLMIYALPRFGESAVPPILNAYIESNDVLEDSLLKLTLRSHKLSKKILNNRPMETSGTYDFTAIKQLMGFTRTLTSTEQSKILDLVSYLDEHGFVKSD